MLELGMMRVLGYEKARFQGGGVLLHEVSPINHVSRYLQKRDLGWEPWHDVNIGENRVWGKKGQNFRAGLNCSSRSLLLFGLAFQNVELTVCCTARLIQRAAASGALSPSLS